MTNSPIWKNATTVAGTGLEQLAGWVLQNEETGQREWIRGASRLLAFKIVSSRPGVWSGRGFGIVNGRTYIYA